MPPLSPASVAFSKLPHRGAGPCSPVPHRSVSHLQMLRDGTNPEGIDPVPPLEWNSKADLTDVVLVNSAPSPPCAKLRYHLAYNDVPYSLMSPAAFKKGKSVEDYVKIPAIFVAGRQVNDSYVITKHLARALYGSKVDEVWDAKITFGLQLAVEVCHTGLEPWN